MTRLAAQQGEREAELVVQVALGLETGTHHGQDRGAHLLRGGLAVAAGNRDHRSREGAAVTGGQAPQRSGGVIDRHDRAVRGNLWKLRLVPHEQSPCARVHSLLQELVGIKALSPNRDEEIAFTEAASVDGHAVEAQIRRPLQLPTTRPFQKR